MHVTAYRLRNFRKLHDVRVDLDKSVSVFVGANNSGKTSATTGVRMFVSGDRKSFSIHDFGSACWPKFEAIAARGSDTDVLPTMSLDIWFHVDVDEMYRVIDLLPSLDWKGNKVGIRVEFAPENQDKLLADYRQAAAEARASKDASGVPGSYMQWPRSFVDYLERSLCEAYNFRYFILDSAKFDDEWTSSDPSASTPFPERKESSGKQVLRSLLHVDFLDAQRPLSTEDGSRATEDLSQRLSKFYRHFKQQGVDHSALQALAESEKNLTEHISSVFKPTLESLQRLGYPGLENPQLTIKSILRPEELLARHGSGARVHYSVPGADELTLPDRYNGLGFKNLIYMVVELLEMHAKWATMERDRPPIHLVFIEEPEAHLHTQLQQVFVKQISQMPALEVLHPYVRQYVVTTHSPHILYHRGFEAVRYFRRQNDQTSQVLSLTDFEKGSPEREIAFLRKYVKLTHCDLFFADAAVLVEGNVERLLLPLMIEKVAPRLASSHLSIIEIGGAFAHCFRGLLEFLGLPVLVVTDLDSVSSGKHRKKCSPETPGAITANAVLSRWLPQRLAISELLAATVDDCTSKPTPNARGRVHVTYQRVVDVVWRGALERKASRTLEEAFAFENLEWVQKEENEKLGLAVSDCNQLSVGEITDRIRHEIAGNSVDKTGFALELLVRPEGEWLVPEYIKQGLRWLEAELSGTSSRSITTSTDVVDTKAPSGPSQSSAPATTGDGKAQLDLAL